VKNTKIVLAVLIYALFIYVAIACEVFRFKHPELTETQLFLKIPDAIFWR
jgi:hypothetical protein